jgi:hypothetical protein
MTASRVQLSPAGLFDSGNLWDGDGHGQHDQGQRPAGPGAPGRVGWPGGVAGSALGVAGLLRPRRSGFVTAAMIPIATRASRSGGKAAGSPTGPRMVSRALMKEIRLSRDNRAVRFAFESGTWTACPDEPVRGRLRRDQVADAGPGGCRGVRSLWGVRVAGSPRIRDWGNQWRALRL